MRRFIIEIGCDTPAFADNPAWEIMTILRKLDRAISLRPRLIPVPGGGPEVSGVVGGEEMALHDSNGVWVGVAKMVIGKGAE